MKALAAQIRTGAFWTLFGLGSALLIFAVLLAQVPGIRHDAFGVMVFSLAGTLLATSLALGMFRGVGHWFLTIVLSGELLLCAYGLWSVLT